MKNYLALFTVASLFLPSLAWWWWQDGSEGGKTFVMEGLNTIDDDRHVHRLAALMRSYVERAEERFREVMGIKKELDDRSIDQKRAFETGYIMGDIIEVYRKALVFTQKQMNRKRYIEAERIRYMMYVQNAYIKAYHLAHMMHEINPKFGTDNSGQITKMNLNAQYQSHSPTYFNASGFYYTKELNAIRDARVEERKKKMEKERNIKYMEMILHGTAEPATVKTTTNWWPIAYGWDIDYYW